MHADSLPELFDRKRFFYNGVLENYLTVVSKFFEKLFEVLSVLPFADAHYCHPHRQTLDLDK